MKFEKINYKKTFNLGNYSTHTIGVEIGLDENDDPKLAMQTASELVHEYHRQSTDGLEHQHIEETIIPAIQVEKPKSKNESLIDDINSCSEIKVLESYKLMAKSNPEVQEVYNNKFQSLKN